MTNVKCEGYDTFIESNGSKIDLTTIIHRGSGPFYKGNDSQLSGTDIITTKQITESNRKDIPQEKNTNQSHCSQTNDTFKRLKTLSLIGKLKQSTSITKIKDIVTIANGIKDFFN